MQRLQKFQINVYVIHDWKALNSEVTDFEYHHDRTPSGEITLSQTSNFKHVDNIKVSVKRTCGTSLESSQLRDHRF